MSYSYNNAQQNLYQGQMGYGSNIYEEDLHQSLLNDSIKELDADGFDQPQQESTDLFDMKSVELINFPAREQKIKHFVSSQNQLIVITETNIVYRYRLDNEQAQELGFQPYYLPKLKGDGGFFKGVGSIVGGKSNKSDSIERAFLDQKGYHAILCSDHGENYYLNLKDEKIKHLNAIRGKTIKVLAFESTTTEDNTKDFIFGTDEGEIYSWSINSKNLESGLLEKQLEISDRNSTQNSISHMHILELQQDQGGRTLLVIISTNQNICCLHGSSELRFLFKKYNDPEKLKQSMVLMPKMHPSVMDICYNQSTRPTSMIWTNGMVIQCYQIPGRKEQITQNIIKNYQAYKYAKRLDPPDNNPYLVQEIPIGIGISEYHYYLLHSDGLTIISRITESVVQHYDLRSMGYVLGMSYDKDQKTYWIYSTNQVQKLDIENENKDAWKLYVEKQDYEQAYNICKEYDNPYKNYIGSLYGDQLFVGKQYVQAAIQYFEVNKSFEEIFLKFTTGTKQIQDRMREGLEKYLTLWLERLHRENNREQIHLKTIVISWLVELKVYKMNVVDRYINNQQKRLELNLQSNKLKEETLQNYEEIKTKQLKLDNELQEFLKRYITDDDENLINLVYQILQSHGRIQNCVNFARTKGSYETIIMHHINEENYEEAINNLELVKDNSDKFEQILLKYCHIFMQFEPRKTIKVLTESKLIQKKSNNFNFAKLIGGLMNIQPQDRGTEGVKFLQHCISQLDRNEKTLQTMNNILIFFLTEPLQLQKLNYYLQDQERIGIERCNFDLDFALRLFKRNQNTYQAQVSVYSMMGLYTEAVNLALQQGDTQLAKEKAKLPDNDDIKKKLQIQIAIYLLGKGGNNIKEVIELTKDDQSQIKIEDLLLHFNENIKIEHFKDEICNSLKNYSEEIEELKMQMEQYAKNAEQLKNESRMIKNRCIEIDSQHKCEECLRSIFRDEFYIFPCMHGFHKECLLHKFRESHVNLEKIRDIEQLNQEINTLLSKSNKEKQNTQQQQDFGFFSFANLKVFGGKEEEKKQHIGLTKEEQQNLEQAKEQFDLLLAGECIFCGPSIVDSIFIPFEIDENEKQSWQL